MRTPAPSIPLPFALAPEDLPSVEIHYGAYSSKTGAGEEEVSLKGGLAVLRRTAKYDAPPEIRESPLAPAALVPLLRVMAAQRFQNLPERPGQSVPTVTRIVKLVTPKLTKQVSVDGEGNPQFERVVGALLATVGQSRPDALDRSFFQLIGLI